MKSKISLLNALPGMVLAAGICATTFPLASHADTSGETHAHGTIHVTKSPSCGCCGAWVALARAEGYEVEVTDTADIVTAKIEAEVPGDMWACHTAKIDGYVLEGHVPFDALKKLLADRPKISGIAVPGMPAGSPGMGNDPTARYDVMSFGGEAGDGALFFQAGQ